MLMLFLRSRGSCDTGEMPLRAVPRTVQSMTRITGITRDRWGAAAVVRIAALAASVVASACLAGCGNGIEVGGPSAPSSPSIVSPGPDRSSAAKTPGRSSSTPAKTSTPTDAKTGNPGGSDGSDHNSDGTGNGSGNGSGANGGPGNGAGKQGGSTSEPPPGGSQPGSGGNSIAKCGLGDLSIGVRTPAGGGAAGSQYVLISFNNTSNKLCTIYGYPGVSFVGFQNGTQLGKPAARNRASDPQRVRLAPGSTKSALLQIAEAGNFPPQKCQPTTSDGFRVYPPDSYTAAYVPFKTSACQSKKVAQLTVYPVGVNS